VLGLDMEDPVMNEKSAVSEGGCRESRPRSEQRAQRASRSIPVSP
jgi:hypothetical protein